MSEVKLVVFNNGLQVIGVYETKNEKTGSITISKPVQLVMMPQASTPTSKDGQVGMAFAPFLQYTEEWKTGLTFVVTDILTVATPLRDLVNSYNQTFGSGLVLPPGVGQG